MKRAFLLAALLIPVTAFAGAKVSTFRRDNKLGFNFYNGSAAIDGKLETAWMVPGESDNRGEWIELDVPAGKVDKLEVVIGYAKDDTTFLAYARIKEAHVDIYSIADDQTVSQVGTATVSFEDKSGLQVVDLPDTQVGGELCGGKVKISIVSIFPGSDAPSLAVSEIAVQMKEFDVPTQFQTVSGESAGHPKEGATDADATTFWAMPAAGAGFELDGAGNGISSIGFVGVEGYARPKTVQITVNGLTRTTVLADKPDVQVAAVPSFNGYTGGAFGTVQVKILDTYPATNADIGLSAVQVHATSKSTF